MTMPVPFSLAVFSLSLLSFSQVARGAASEEMQDRLNKACQPDIKQYCNDITPGEGRIMACLKAHDDKLSSGCKDQWKAAKAEWHNTMKKAHKACADDVQKFCSNAENPKDVMDCLNEHSAELSSSCKEFKQSHGQQGSMHSQNTTQKKSKSSG